MVVVRQDQSTCFPGNGPMGQSNTRSRQMLKSSEDHQAVCNDTKLVSVKRFHIVLWYCAHLLDERCHCGAKKLECAIRPVVFG